MNSSPGKRRINSKTDPESGYVLLAVLFMVVLVLLALAIAAPKIATQIQRDKETELIHRGEQYRRAIKVFYKKFGRYPTSIDQLENTNNLRFLRKRYLDPLTGKDDWKIIRQADTLLLSATPPGQLSPTTGETWPSDGPGLNDPGGIDNSSSSNPTTPVSNGSNGSSSSSGSAFGNSSFGSQPGTTGNSAFGGSNSGSSFGSGSGSTTGFGSSSGSGFGSGTGSGTGSGSGQVFGGIPIAGVYIPMHKAALKQYKKQSYYDKWMFVYDPSQDQLQGGGFFGGQGNTNLPGQPGTGTNSSGTGFPSNNGFNGSGSNSSTPSNPLTQ